MGSLVSLLLENINQAYLYHPTLLCIYRDLTLFRYRLRLYEQTNFMSVHEKLSGPIFFTIDILITTGIGHYILKS